MDRKNFQSSIFLLIAAIIWGCAFVAQKIGMKTIGPFWYTGLRFALGTVLIFPLIFFEKPEHSIVRRDWLSGIGIGLLLFIAINLQQIALIYARVSNTGFITSLYVALVPIICMFSGHRYGIGVWGGAFMATAGLYLLSVHGELQIDPGDFFTLLSAFFWAFQVIALSTYGHGLPPIRMAVTQSATCVVLSLAVAVFREPISLKIISNAGIPLLYGSVMSVAIGFTLQVLAQRHIRAAHTAIILSLESVIAAGAGWLFLHEVIDIRALVGCALILIGTIWAQLSSEKTPSKRVALVENRPS